MLNGHQARLRITGQICYHGQICMHRFLPGPTLRRLHTHPYAMPCPQTHAFFHGHGNLFRAAAHGQRVLGAAGITSSEFNLRKLDQYERWFDDKSSMTLAQTGVYKGLDAVLEYSKFIFPGSPYISTNGNLGSEFTFVSVDAEKRSCVFIVVEQQRYVC